MTKIENKPVMVQWSQCPKCGIYWYEWKGSNHTTDVKPLLYKKATCPECVSESKKKSQIPKKKEYKALSEDERNELMERVKAGKKPADIAREFNVTISTVSYYRHKVASSLSNEQINAMIEQAINGVTIPDLAENFGVRRSYVRHVIREWRKHQQQKGFALVPDLESQCETPEELSEKQLAWVKENGSAHETQIANLQAVIARQDSEMNVMRKTINHLETRISELSLRLEMEEENHNADIVSYKKSPAEIIGEMSVSELISTIKEMLK